MATTSYEDLGTGYLLTRDLMAAAWDEYATGRLHEPYVSPLVEPDFRGVAPALVISAEFDPLRDEGTLYVERLRASGVPAREACYPRMIHGFVGMGSLFDETKHAIAEAVEALRQAFGENRRCS
jgi:acetyl esterase